MSSTYAAQPDSSGASPPAWLGFAPDVRRVAVIGDIGGHRHALATELGRLGADPSTGALPADLAVVQVGDLVHRGPDSEGVVALIDGYLAQQPGQWVQLVGNHEAQYLRDPVFDWPERVDGATAEMLRRWWATGLMRVALAVQAITGDFLITHAGVTSEFWQDELAAVPSAAEAAYALNVLGTGTGDAVFRAGEMLGRRAPSWSAGPLWASAPNELLPSWLGVPLPFNQIHGHTSVHDWEKRVKRGGMDVTFRTKGNPDTKHESTRLEGGLIIGIDPCHGHEPRSPWRALELELLPDRIWVAG
jgi:hypothetical protein